MIECLRQLVETFGPSGREDRVRALISGLIGGHVDDLRTDAMGNLVALKRGDGTGQRLMLAAHMDEIGLIVSYIDEKGFVRVQPMGGVNPWLEVGGRVQFENGCIGVVSHDKLSHGEAVPPMEKLFVDVGAASRQDCPVGLGDVACFLQPLARVGGLLTAKAMDDRVGCAVLIETLRRLEATPHECYVVFSAQEEVGTRGAVTAAYGVAPDVGLAVDVTLAGDVPEPAVRMATALGAGPAIKIKDGGMIATPWVKDWMIDVAQAEGLPFQLEVLPGGTTDARAIQTSRGGVPAGCLSIPCRYVHSPSETVSPADLGHAVDLLVAMLRRPLPR